jgi:cytochrome P450
LDDLVYFKAAYNETLRLDMPATLATPFKVVNEFKVRNYTLSPGKMEVVPLL